MSQVTIVKVVVEELSKYGYKANGKYVGLSKNLSDADKARLVPGASFEAEYFVADSGKEYLNKILSITNMERPGVIVVEKLAKSVDSERAVKNTPKAFKPSYTKKAEATSAGMTKEEWQMKDQRISRQGVIQAAVIALAPVVSLEQLPEEAIKLAETMLEFVKGGN